MVVFSVSNSPSLRLQGPGPCNCSFNLSAIPVSRSPFGSIKSVLNVVRCGFLPLITQRVVSSMPSAQRVPL